ALITKFKTQKLSKENDFFSKRNLSGKKQFVCPPFHPQYAPLSQKSSKTLPHSPPLTQNSTQNRPIPPHLQTNVKAVQWKNTGD
ncbi:MAG: hypothetical protein SPH19_07465, partial [Sodaliphilus sp.]|nr:hypothetical protein [Sodaliphilus sp.]